ncbi:hypothetical protein C6499_02680 [Candidatus Poribacteria bacterium]|nr:MAG: hypothetical protein C6499_02680 [Candidatus Poribacteria bacterium]
MFCEHYFYTHIVPLGLLFAAIKVSISMSFYERTNCIIVKSEIKRSPVRLLRGNPQKYPSKNTPSKNTAPTGPGENIEKLTTGFSETIERVL